MIDYYEILGVSRGAMLGAIRKAYKAIAMRAHPDRNQDDPEATQKFQVIQKAYETLSNTEKRAQYDRGIEFGIDTTFDVNDEAIKGLRESFIMLILEDQINVDTVDLIKQSRIIINKEIKTLNNRNIAIPRDILKLEKARKKVKKKKGGSNLFDIAFHQKHIMLGREKIQTESKIMIFERMLVLLEEYEYEIEAIVQPWQNSSTTAWMPYPGA